jgi:hypothetical protein
LRAWRIRHDPDRLHAPVAEIGTTQSHTRKHSKYSNL